jgi:hypothetical protein
MDRPIRGGITMEHKLPSKIAPDEANLIQMILRAIHEIRFGSVQIVIQDAKVVQIEKHEKVRLV